MPTPDLNLLITLDALLAEGSVARAARRLRLSASAMSRALARLRATTGDPLLVSAGRALAPTPRALELRAQVSRLVHDAQMALQPAAKLDPGQLVRTFTLRTRDGFVENFGPALLERVGAQAPGVHLCFVQKPDKDAAALRDGIIDLETGVVDVTTGLELRARTLFSDHFVGVVRTGHALARGNMTAARYAKGRHIGLALRGGAKGQIDVALASMGLERNIVVTVGGFSTALALARNSDLIASVPARHSGSLRDGMYSFALPVELPQITVSLLWHPRFDADQAHRWLRGLIMEACAVVNEL